MVDKQILCIILVACASVLVLLVMMRPKSDGYKGNSSAYGNFYYQILGQTNEINSSDEEPCSDCSGYNRQHCTMSDGARGVCLLNGLCRRATLIGNPMQDYLEHTKNDRPVIHGWRYT